MKSCFAPCFFYYSFPHISCCYTCNCNENYVGRRKGALVQCDSWDFWFVNPPFQQQIVLHTTSFLKSSSLSTCTSLYIGRFFNIFFRHFWMKRVHIAFCLYTDFFVEYLCFFSILVDSPPSSRNQWTLCFNSICSLIFWRRYSLNSSIDRCPFASFFSTTHSFWSDFSLHVLPLVLYTDVHNKYTFLLDLSFLRSYCWLCKAVSFIFIMAWLWLLRHRMLHFCFSLCQKSIFQLPVVPTYSTLICIMELPWSTWFEILLEETKQGVYPRHASCECAAVYKIA